MSAKRSKQKGSFAQEVNSADTRDLPTGESGAPYLRQAKIVSYGATSNKVFGSFSPGLNVVFGHNEAGKTTLASFVGGVLFGWEDARSSHNTYRPENAERAGSLFFASRTGSEEPGQEEQELRRARNADGLQGNTALVDDIDRETYRTMFSLTSDELRSLRNSTDITAKLLTAGSGTGSSPANALAAVQERLAACTSRAAGAEGSLMRLNDQLADIRAQMKEASDQAERYRKEDKEFHDLHTERQQLFGRMEELDASIEAMTEQRAKLKEVEGTLEQLREQLAALQADEQKVRTAHRLQATDVPRALLDLRSADERALRDKIDRMATEEAKCEHAVDLAQDTCSTSRAAYEALIETEEQRQSTAHQRRQRTVQVALSVILPCLFTGVGIPVFMRGRDINSLSFTALGLLLVVFALLLAAAALVMLFRPSKEENAQDARRQDAQWVMLQDQKKLEACQAAQERCAQRIRQQLDQAGLADAQGSIRMARELLEDAREVREDNDQYLQRRQAFASRRADLDDRFHAAQQQRDQLIGDLGLSQQVTTAMVDEALAQKTRQRAALRETSDQLNRRYGELKQELSQARTADEFDRLKLAYQQTVTRKAEAAENYARLLLAARMLEAAIAAWESKSQPEVYRQASRLLANMTQGRWVKVDLSPEGRLRVTDSVKNVRDPYHLSLGTCQQLYLSLRLALLMTADGVGRSIPILADDILVNFDAARRQAAAFALAELAETRQVILFTCHEEIVETVRAADSSVNVVYL